VKTAAFHATMFTNKLITVKALLTDPYGTGLSSDIEEGIISGMRI
jgi:hypothetical protein